MIFQYIVTLDNGDTLISREVENPDNYIEGKFTEEGMVLVSGSVTTLGNLLDFEPLFKEFGNN